MGLRLYTVKSVYCVGLVLFIDTSISSILQFHRHVHYSVPLGCHTPLLTFPGRLPYPTLTCPYTDLALGSAERNVGLWNAKGVRLNAAIDVMECLRRAVARSGLNSLLLRFTTLHFARHCPASPYTAYVWGDCSEWLLRPPCDARIRANIKEASGQSTVQRTKAQDLNRMLSMKWACRWNGLSMKRTLLHRFRVDENDQIHVYMYMYTVYCQVFSG